MNPLKVVILGDADSGKTSLAKALAGERFDPNEPPTETRTARRITFPSSLSSSSSFGETTTWIDVDVWDCGLIVDEEDLRKFVSDANAVVLTFDTSQQETLESVERVWLDAVIRNCSSDDDVFFVLVGCKSDSSNRSNGPSSLDIETVCMKAGSMLYVETSARDRFNVDLLLGVLKLRVMERRANVALASSSSWSSVANKHRLKEERSQIGGGELSVLSDAFDRLGRAYEADSGPTTMRIHRSGSVDLDSQGAGVNVHVSSDGKFQVASSPQKAATTTKGGSARKSTSSLPLSDAEALISNEPTTPSTKNTSLPLLVDVSLGGGIIGTIPFYRDDDPLDAAKKFVTRHGIPFGRAPELARIVEARVAEFLDGEAMPSIPPIPTGQRRGLPRFFQQQQPSEVVIARLKVTLGDGRLAMVSVREGDDTAHVVEMFRLSNGLDRGDPVLQEVATRVDLTLANSQSSGSDPPFVAQLRQAASLTETQRRLLLRTLGVPPESSNSPAPAVLSPTFVGAQNNEVESVPPNTMEPPPFREELQQQKQPPSPMPRFVPNTVTPPPVSSSSVTTSTSLTPQRATRTPTQRTPTQRNHMQTPTRTPGRAPSGNAIPAPPPSRYETPKTPAAARVGVGSSGKSTGPRPTNGSRNTSSVTPGGGGGALGRVPMFYVEVEVRAGEMEKLAVFRDDNLANLAEEFLRRHNLPLTKQFKLQQLLEHHMRVHKDRLAAERRRGNHT